MEFLNPLFLAASAAVAAPIIIHLLNRQRYRKVEWAAMRFVLEAVKRTHRRLRLEELILLIVRCLILCLLALALARPYVTGSFLGFASQGSHYAIVAIDGSYSMGVRVGHQTLFDRAKERAAAIIDGLESGDKLSVVVLSHDARPMQADPTVQFEDAKTQLMNLEPTHGAASMDRALETLQELVKKAPLKNVHLYVLTDNQRRFWNGLKEEARSDARIALANLAEKTRTFVIDVGADAGNNLTLADLRTSVPVITVRHPFKFLADVTNYGVDVVANAEVTLFVEERRQRTVTITVPPGETRTVGFDYRFDRTGPVPVRVELSADSLDLDNHRFLAVVVEEGLPVLVVDPRFPGEASETESYRLRLALNPRFKEGSTETSQIIVTATSPRDLDSLKLSDYRVIFMTNVGELPAGSAVKLTSFVRDGGGLVIFAGDQVTSNVYNRSYFDDGRGFLPVAIGARQGDRERRQFTEIRQMEADHPVLHQLEDLGLSLKHLFVFQYVGTDETRMPEDTFVLARYVRPDGAGEVPAIVERIIGKGRSILITTSAGDPMWAEMFVGPMFPLLIQELTRYASGGTLATNNVGVGEPLSKTLSSELFQKEVLLKPPEREPIPQKVSKDEDEEFRISFDASETSGLYLLQRSVDGTPGPDDTLGWFSVNIDAREGDLLREPQEELKPFLKERRIVYLAAAGETAEIDRKSGGAEYWKEIFFILFLLMAAEMFLAWRFGSFRKKQA